MRALRYHREERLDLQLLSYLLHDYRYIFNQCSIFFSRSDGLQLQPLRHLSNRDIVRTLLTHCPCERDSWVSFPLEII